MAFGKNTIDAAQHNRIAQMLHHLGIIAERADQGIVIAALDGTIHFANTAWANMHGRENSKKILGKSITSFFDKDSGKESLIRLIKQARTSGCASAVIQHRKLDFSTFPARTKITAIKGKNECPDALIIFSADISEITKIQKQLAQTSEELQNSRSQIELLKQQLEDLKNQPAVSLPNPPAVSLPNPPAVSLPNPPAVSLPNPLAAAPAPAKDEQLEQKNQPSIAPPKTEESEQTPTEQFCPEHSRGGRSAESAQGAASANGPKNTKHAPKPFNAERLKALAYLSRRLNEPLAKPSNQSYPDDDNLLNPPPLLDIEQLKAVAEIAKRLA